MKVDSALELVNSLVFFPGWEVSAEDHTRRFEGSIKVRIDYPSHETAREQAKEGYPEPIFTYATFPVIVETCVDGMMLYRKILNAILKIYAHEAREALRVKPTLWAPFHPHQIDGMKNWRNTEVMCDDGIMLEDMQFGIA